MRLNKLWLSKPVEDVGGNGAIAHKSYFMAPEYDIALDDSRDLVVVRRRGKTRIFTFVQVDAMEPLEDGEVVKRGPGRPPKVATVA